MSIPVVRLGDQCSGHYPCFGPRPSVSGSPDVMVESIPAIRVGDPWALHCCGSCHTGTTAKGSGTVFANGQPLMRIGDQIDCGSVSAQGASTVFAGG